MTLHIRTTTPEHIIIASDRLLYTPFGYYIESQNDFYKHLCLICENAKAVISFTGFAGIPTGGKVLKENTMDWLREVLMSTSKRSHDINEHIRDIAKQAQNHMDYLRRKYRIKSEDCALAIHISGWCNEGSFDCFIENYQNKQCLFSKVRNDFTVWINKNFDSTAFAGGPLIMVQGRRDLVDARPELITELENIARSGGPKEIFDCSVRIIRKIASLSQNTVGYNCSGIRMSRNDSGSEIYNDRDDVLWDVVMPDVVVSTKRFSGYVGGMRGRNSVT